MHAVEFRHFSKRNGAFTLDDVDFPIRSGYINGLIGPNGSGKTTLIRSIMNLVRPDSGEVAVFGRRYVDGERDIKRRIGFVYDEDFFYNHLSVNEMKKIVASFYPTWNEAIFAGYLEKFQLPGRRKIRDLSKGMKTKFALAAALAHEPELLIMDEPTSGLDPVFRREVLGILSDFIQDGARSVLFSTHICADLERIADYIVYIRGGRIRFCGTMEQLADTYVLVKGPLELLRMPGLKQMLVGARQHALGFEGLIGKDEYTAGRFDDLLTAEAPSLDDILFYTREEG